MGNMEEFLRAMQRNTDAKKDEYGSEALNKFDKSQFERNLNELLKEINQIQDEDAMSHLLERLSFRLNKFKMFDKSLQIINKISEKERKEWAYVEIATSFASIGRYNEAVKLMKKAGSSHHQWPRIIKYAIELQDFDAAEEIAKNIDSLDEQSRQLKTIRAHKNRYCPLIKDDDELFVVVSNELAKNLRLRNGDKATIRIL
ncbi:hypothetical protein BMS3Abin16_01531 [archaeon BMS3Abin16]|nr:hypothetical protein BMS3Abin16_01531 [archaeon BMS3Abin16]